MTPEPVSNFNDVGLGPPTYDVDPSLKAAVMESVPQPRDKWPYDEGEEVPVDELRPGANGGWVVVLEGEEPGSFWFAHAEDVRRWVYADDELLEEAREHLRMARSLTDECSRQVPGAAEDMAEALRKVKNALSEKKPEYAYHT